MRTTRNILVSLLGALVILAVSATPAAGAPAAQGNLLRNGDFESGFYNWNGDGQRQVPDEWAPWWNGSLATPHFNASEAPSRVQSGARSASYWEQYRDYEAGLYQIVPGLTNGTIYRFTIYGHAWSTTKTDKSTSDTDVQMQIGIDPKGGDNPSAGSIVWSGTISARDTYQLFSVDAAAQGTQVTVWVRGKTVYPVTQTDFYWDNASLVAVGQAAAPTAAPTQASGGGGNSGGGGGGGGCDYNSVPAGSIQKAAPQEDGSIIHTVQRCETLTGIAVTYGLTLEQIRQMNNLSTDVLTPGQQLLVQEAAAEPTPVPPTATPTPLAEIAEEPASTEEGSSEAVEPEASGTICIMSYEDLNGNGIREPEEPKLAGVTFAVGDSTSTVGTYTTDGIAEPYCFSDLDAGSYTVSWAGDNLTPTTEQTLAANLAPGATVSREFGVSLEEDAGEESSGGGQQAGGLPTWATAVIGALGAILFLTGLGAAGYFLLLRRSQI